MDSKEKLIQEIMREAEADGEPVTREEAEEMAEMELKSKDIRRHETAEAPKEKKKREVKLDGRKVDFISIVKEWLLDNAEDVVITNPQREVSFTLVGESYSLVLIKHRKKKEEK